MPGLFGGNRRLKIYGRLDCPSALRALPRGYAKRRVFFADEAAAIAAGYRPCAVCMPAEYRRWKAVSPSIESPLVKPKPPAQIGERRYTEEELALILNRAAERQEGVQSGAPRYTLAEIQEIAAGAGIAPEHVASVATTLRDGAGDARRRTARRAGSLPVRGVDRRRRWRMRWSASCSTTCAARLGCKGQ